MLLAESSFVHALFSADGRPLGWPGMMAKCYRLCLFVPTFFDWSQSQPTLKSSFTLLGEDFASLKDAKANPQP